MNQGREILRFHADDPATAPIKVSHEVALILVRRHTLYLHNWFQKDGGCFLKGIFHREDRGELESELVRIDVVI